MDQKLLNTLAPKLNIKSPKVIGKAVELMRLAEAKSHTSAGLQLTGSCRAVVLLDLAASALGEPIDKTCAVKLSGQNKRIYTSSHKALECLLDMQPKITIREMAVQFGCTGAVELAHNVLKSYQTLQEDSTANDDMDFDRPLFQGAALFAACRKMKVKIEKTRLVEMVGTKRTIFDKLVAVMEGHVNKIAEEKKKKQEKGPSKRPRTFLEQLENAVIESEVTSHQQEVDDDLTREDYGAWKKRILENARKSLKAGK
ncbi:origin recognition complex subunit 6-like [Lineus longissimus]|uniref:origin recognition complex subunit 6-like n=1 Tax=Lineus longissimus TaxID=88925 RepID=UPI00315CB83B